MNKEKRLWAGLVGLAMAASGGLSVARAAEGWFDDLPRYLSCRARVERHCLLEGCADQPDPPMELTVDLATGDGSFCLYTFCGVMYGELDLQGQSIFSGSIHVLATINDITDIMDYGVSYDAAELTFSVITPSGGEISSYVGTCEERHKE